MAQDAIMPHMEQVFGLTEEAAVLVLVEMGLIKSHNNGKYVMIKQGWTNLGALFKVDNLVEVSPMSWDKKEYWYVRLGTVGISPLRHQQQIRQKHNNQTTTTLQAPLNMQV